jgi:16S rRNA (guanine527-N7)-methyltransferase
VFAELLRQRLSDIVELSDGQIEALESHYHRLVKWNRTLNLTSIASLEEAIERHYCESLFAARVLDAWPQRIVDIGSGAGFPGFPLAIVRPDCSVTLIEAHQRKAVFLKEASRELANVRVLAQRAEDVEQRFEWAVSRAVSYSDLSEALPRLAPKAALLTGAELPSFPAYTWAEAIRLPWGQQRYLRIGRVVSRET